MIRSTDCERNYHHLCDGWYGHQTHECECSCHTPTTDEDDPSGGGLLGWADGRADRTPDPARLAYGMNRVNDYERGYIDSGRHEPTTNGATMSDHGRNPVTRDELALAMGVHEMSAELVCECGFDGWEVDGEDEPREAEVAAWRARWWQHIADAILAEFTVSRKDGQHE